MTSHSLESRKKAVRSATDMLSVVRTMKAMAAVNIRQFEAAADSLQDYTHAIDEAISMLMTKVNVDDNPEFKTSSDQSRTGAIIFGSDQGMCGSFNETIASFALQWLSGNQTSAGETISAPPEHNPELPPPIVIGFRAADTLQTYKTPAFHVSRLPGTSDAITTVSHDMLPVIERWKTQHGLQKVILFHNRRISSSMFRPHATQLFPVRFDRIVKSAEKRKSDSKRTRRHRSLPWWSLPTEELFSFTIRQHIFANLFLAMADSLSAENAARIAAMQSAEHNIRDRLEILQHAYSQHRQANITSELLDITSGFLAQS